MTAKPLELPDLTLDQLEVSADNLDIRKAAGIYNTFGCLVVRGLMRQYLEPISRQINQLIDETYQQFDQAEAIPEGWMTPNGCLLIPAPETFERDKQIMCLPLSYRNSSAFFQTALDPTTLDLVEGRCWARTSNCSRTASRWSRSRWADTPNTCIRTPPISSTGTTGRWGS